LENKVAHYMRRGRSREDAVKLATWDLEQLRRDRELLAGPRAELAATTIEPGDIVRVRTGRTDWVVVKLRPTVGGARADLRSTSSTRTTLERLADLRPVQR
jgi:hypothetical protein